MKKIMMFVAAMVIATASANASVNEFNAYEGESIQKETEAFSMVSMNIPARVRIVAGDEYSVSVSAENIFVAEAINLNVKNDVLCISTRDIEALGDGVESLVITIVSPTLPAFTTSDEMESTVIRDID